MIEIRQAKAHNFVDVEIIVKELPQWFTQGGIESIRKDLHFQKTLLAKQNDKILGFITYYSSQGNGHIGWMGVLPTAHRKGIGRALISELIQDFKSQGITSIYVSTLGDTVEYPPYAETRAFYRAVGFSDFKRLQHPDNPECEEELILKMEAPPS